MKRREHTSITSSPAKRTSSKTASQTTTLCLCHLRRATPVLWTPQHPRLYIISSQLLRLLPPPPSRALISDMLVALSGRRGKKKRSFPLLPRSPTLIISIWAIMVAPLLRPRSSDRLLLTPTFPPVMLFKALVSITCVRKMCGTSYAPNCSSSSRVKNFAPLLKISTDLSPSISNAASVCATLRR